MPAGRPTDYREEYAEQARKLCELGATNSDLAEAFGVSSRTIARWRVNHEDFCQALRVGGEHANERVRNSLYHKAVGYDYVEQQAVKVKVAQYEEKVEVVDVQRHVPADTVAAKFWLINKDRDANGKPVWSDKVNSEVSGPGGGPVETRDLKLDALSDDEVATLKGLAKKTRPDDR